MELEDYFKNCRVRIWEGTFAVTKSKRPHPSAFANIVNKNEVTVIVDESKVREEDIIEIEKGWKILTFDIVLPFELVGFLAKVSQALAEEGIPILAVSAYSTDHILVKQRDLTKAIRKLKDLGCLVEELE